MNRNRVLWPSLSVCVLAFLLIFLTGAASMVEAAPWQDEALAPQPPLSCRFGATISSVYPNQASWLEPLGASWYLDFTAHVPSSLTSAEFVQVIRVRQNKVGCDYVPGYTSTPNLTKSALSPIIASQRGALWIIGNEPDRGPNPDRCWERGQDDTMPEVYAQIYHDAYTLIKSLDPTARIAVAGLVEVTPGRLQYLDKVWQAYLSQYGTTMPVDVWNFHLYVLPEADPDGQPNGTANVALGTDVALAKRWSGGDKLKCDDPNVYCTAEHDDMTVFDEQIMAMRRWMEQHGQRDKPLILTEYSILYPYVFDADSGTYFLCDEYDRCFTPERVRSFMTASFNYLDSEDDADLGYPADQNRLVQRWLWFGTFYYSDPESAGYVSHLLVDSQDALTSVGQLFQSSVAGRTTYVNLRVDRIPTILASASFGKATASLSVTVYNAGTAPTSSPFTVTFYSDKEMTQPIGSAVVAAGLPGCEARRATATVSWPNLGVGSHPFWVRIDSAGAIGESDESDNTGSASVKVVPYRLIIPLTFR